ncbi:MAG: thioredoxin domain-containing protein [Myxococcales bacterium]|nr:thioredoxin domain-containing protein [Myxococcales bacterium]
MPRLRLAALLAALALAPACGHGDGAAATTAPASAEPGEPDWAPWEAASFERAQRDDKIILINVIATWCHWCHVMDEETYSDPRVAALLAERFVTIRVDAVAHPDLAERYAAWGWPAIAFLSADARPVLELRGFKNPETFGALLRELVADRDAGTLSQRTSPDDEVRPVEGELGPVLAHATAQIDGFYDEALGGWGRRQKYPFPGPLEHALWRVRIHGERQGLQRAALTLENEKKINDPVWGGVFQYSVDGDWDHPHYEKITAIQAGAIENYALMARMSGDDRWLDTAREVAGYMRTMMRDPEGGFYTSQDADLRREGAPTVLGQTFYAADDAERRRLGLPRIDDSVYADLNGLMIRALVELYAATGDVEELEAATGAAEHLLRTHGARGGAFLHGASDDPQGLLYLRDQAAMGLGLLALYRATGDDRWLDAARRTAEFMRAELEDPRQGGFFAHTADPQAVGVFKTRRKPVEENGLAARLMIELHRYLDGDGRTATPYREAAERALAAVGQPSTVEPEGRIIGKLLLALESVLMPTVDVTVVGAPTDERTRALHRAALRYPEPRAVVEGSLPGERYPDIGKPAVYLCTDTACSSPITDPARLPRLADEFLAESLPPRPR